MTNPSAGKLARERRDPRQALPGARSGGYAEQEAGTKQTCSDGTQPGRSTGLTEPNWTMTQIANSLQVLERIGGDDGTRTRGLCRDSDHFTRN